MYDLNVDYNVISSGFSILWLSISNSGPYSTHHL